MSEPGNKMYSTLYRLYVYMMFVFSPCLIYLTTFMLSLSIGVFLQTAQLFSVSEDLLYYINIIVISAVLILGLINTSNISVTFSKHFEKIGVKGNLK